MLGAPPTNRERFLAGIAERVSPDRVQALYLFAPIRQGPVETGVAVLACDPLVPASGEGLAASGDAGANAGTVSTGSSGIVVDDAMSEQVPSSPTPDTPDTRYPIPDTRGRPVVLTARYRHTLKGADRGKWEIEVHEQADAPLATLERVMRGVQERLDEDVEPERLEADALRAARADGVWTPPQR